LQSTQSGWLIDKKGIGDCFVNNFKEIFTSTNPSPHEELLALFECFVFEEDNILLCATPIESEIFASLISLGQSKAPGPDGFTVLFYATPMIVLQAIGNFFQHNQFLRE
jgi:hypothetical protein